MEDNGISEEIFDDNSLLLCLKPQNTQKDINSIINILVKKKNMFCVYVCLRKPYSVLKKIFEKQGLDLKSFFFIDAVDKTPGEPSDEVLYTETAAALTEIDMAINKILKKLGERGFVFIESLEGLTLKNNNNTVAMFIRDIVAKSTEFGSKVIVLDWGKGEEEVIDKVEAIFDRIIRS